MPIYEYKCKDCGEHYERRQKVTDEPLKICEKCSGTLEKQWSRTGFQFKGDGWYVTDYASKKPSEKSSGSESTAKSDSASNKQSDKPASKKTD
jgi:putative FmdB family regulatory protein